MNFLSIFDSAEFAIQDKGDEDMRYTGSEHIETLNFKKSNDDTEYEINLISATRHNGLFIACNFNEYWSRFIKCKTLATQDKIRDVIISAISQSRTPEKLLDQIDNILRECYSDITYNRDGVTLEEQKQNNANVLKIVKLSDHMPK